jgi:serine protease Do
MSPNASSEVAGAEWYDSGIGFAIPLSDIQRKLDAMKKGDDVFPGLLGIALKGGSIYSLAAEIAACQVTSPAYEAGLRAGDTIVEVDGRPIQRQAQLKHALGPRYAGDTVHVVVRRGEQRVEADVTLVDRLIPYDHPFLGILPRRDGAGLVVRHVFPGSGAAAAGIEVGDKIVQVGEVDIAEASALRELLVSLEPQEEVQVKVTRGDQDKSVTARLGSLPTTIPESLPAARSDNPNAAAAAAADLIEIKIPEQPNTCFAFVPPSYRADVPHGVVVYLRPPGELDKSELLSRWRAHCESHDLILLGASAAGLEPLDADRSRVCSEDLGADYRQLSCR